MEDFLGFWAITCAVALPIVFAIVALCVIVKSRHEERMKMIEEDHGCEITCNFCNERYHFSEEELRDLERFIETYARD